MSWKQAIHGSLFAVAALAPIMVHSQPGVLQPTSGPGGGPVRDLTYASDGDLFAFAGIFTLGLHRSDDAGWSWQEITSVPGTHRLAAGLGSDLWAWGNAGLHRTVNDGNSWTQLPSAPATINTVAFAAPQRVFAATTHGVFVSNDAGMTWTRATDIPATDAASVVSSPGTTSAAAGNGIYRTDDGGVTWALVAQLHGAATALAAHPQGGYYAGIAPSWIEPPGPGGVYRVHPDGTSVLTGLASHYIESLLVRSDGALFAGSGGVFDGWNPFGMGLYWSPNGNDPWSFAGCSGDVDAIARDADDRIFAATLDGFTDVGMLPACGVITTSGSAAEWEGRNHGLGGATIYDLASSDAGVLYAAAGWTIAWTDDDGTSWNEVETQLPLDWPDEGTWDLAVHPDGTLFASNASEPLYRTTDRGRTCTALNAPAFGKVDVTITSRGSLLLATSSNLLRSTDHGETWTTLVSSSQILSLASGPLERVAVSTFAGIRLAENDGTTWGATIPTFGRAAFSPDEHSLYVATGNEVRRWVEEAGGWVSQPMPLFQNAEEVAVDPEGRVYAVGASVAWLSPGDVAWQSLGGNTSSGWYIGQRPSLVFGNDGYLYVGTAWDGVYRSATPIDSPTSVEDLGRGVLAAWGCTPNPARGRSTLTFALRRSSAVQLSVYDVRGRIVAQIANGEHFTPGTHSLSWTPPRDTPSGVYTFRLRTGDVISTGRVVLIR